MTTEEQRSALRERLQMDRTRLQEQIHTMEGGIRGDTFGEDETDAADQHPADDGSETFEREKNLTVLGTLRITMQEIDDALQKFDDGTYGICETCGNPIPDKRLDAIPSAIHCIECQSKLEHQVAAAH